MNARFLQILAVSLPQLFVSSAIAGVAAPKEPVAPPLEEPTASPRAFRFSAGWMYRSLGGVEFQPGSRSQSVRLPSLFGSASLREPAIGAADGFADRLYDDGFVRVDQGTATDGSTAYWGYDSSSQVQGEFLDFHANGRRSEAGGSSSYAAPDPWGFDADGGAPVVALDWSRAVGPRWALGVQAQWSFLGVDGNHEDTNFTATQSGAEYALGFVDRYALQGMIPPLAPYQGSPAGNGPLLDNIPASRSRSESMQSGGQALFFNDLRESLDVEVHTLSLGPTLAARLGPSEVQLSAGFAANITQWDASHRETLQVSRDGGRATRLTQWEEHSSDTDILAGFYIQGAVSLPLTERLSLAAFGRYDWSQSLDGTVGPSSFSVDLGGWSVGALIGISF